MPENKKHIKISVTLDLTRRYRFVQQKAKDLKIPTEPLEESLENSIKRAIDLFEINHLEPRGHQLSPELQLMKSKRQNGIEKALKSREERRLSLAEASSQSESIHHFTSNDNLVLESNEASVKDFNRKLKKLASVVSVVSDEECKTRKLKGGINDLLLENGWSDHEKVVYRIFKKSSTTKTDQKLIEPENSAAE